MASKPQYAAVPQPHPPTIPYGSTPHRISPRDLPRCSCRRPTRQSRTSLAGAAVEAAVAEVQEEVDRVVGDADRPTLAQYRDLKYTMRCVNESMRMFPHPPVLLRRALREDTLPSGLTVPKDQDVMISVYNIHRSPAVWDDPDEFRPERFPLDEAVPNESNTGYRCGACTPPPPLPHTHLPASCNGRSVACCGFVLLQYVYRGLAAPRRIATCWPCPASAAEELKP